MIFRFFRFQKTSQGFFLPRRNKNIPIPPHRSAETIQNLLLNSAFVIDTPYLFAFLGAHNAEGGCVSCVYVTSGVFKKINHKQTFPVHHRLLYRNSPPLHAFPTEWGKRHCLYLFQIHALAPLQEIFQADADTLHLFRRCLRICR